MRIRHVYPFDGMSLVLPFGRKTKKARKHGRTTFLLSLFLIVCPCPFLPFLSFPFLPSRLRLIGWEGLKTAGSWKMKKTKGHQLKPESCLLLAIIIPRQNSGVDICIFILNINGFFILFVLDSLENASHITPLYNLNTIMLGHVKSWWMNLRILPSLLYNSL